ncbi:sensor histidine kinase [Nitratidesulfovibrio vulgaris]|uniref:sensor histidine kinase n=1 Tax=Nitratidesulfovibrio vulgaris TaxID=881 RepID=UPI0001A80CE3|nr:HAMP domain-containing sensor histidine kinase [Nitratidesulfovibrio vulgaris]ADP87883.1 response regulator receiver sensor signal transduction histidine kinase [Nitratidesulfovibrio vulgaris RCH1]
MTQTGQEKDDLLFFAEEEQPGQDVPRAAATPWYVLVADDDAEVQTITRLVLSDFSFEGRKLHLLEATSGAESLDMLRRHPDTAVLLLDVVMESNDAGLQVARKVREELGNNLVRIVLRTGQPGHAPEHRVIAELDINDYRHKTELTAERLHTTVTAALPSFRDLRAVEEGRERLAHLAMSVAHQVRNRTMTIGGFASLAVRRAPAEDPVRGYLDTIIEESRRLEHMVGAVSDFASLPHAIRTVVPVGESVLAALEQARQRAAQQGRTLHWQVEVPDGHMVHGAASLLQRLVFEILANASDFAREDGGEVSCRLLCVGGLCRVEVADNGPGIAPEDMAFIFDPFFSRKADGVGMGLCIARRIAGECGWDIEVDAGFGRGARVSVLLPSWAGNNGHGRFA